MMDQKIIPMARAVRLATARGEYYVVQACPYCRRQHTHGGEGLRVSHCHYGIYVVREGKDEPAEARP